MAEIFIVMKQSKRFSDAPAYIQVVFSNIEKAEGFLKRAKEKDHDNWYYIDDREVEE